MVAPRACILLVDDDPGISDALAELLRDEGYAVATATNGEEALAYLRGHESPCVVLLDLMMPVMDGYAFRAAQRKDASLAHIPVFAITAGAGERLAELAVAALFKKPLDLDALLPAIAERCR